MSQKTRGLYRLTQVPLLYEALQSALGAGRSRQLLVEQYIRPNRFDRVLDLGCGPAAILPLLKEVTYIGIDLNPAHISSAQLAHGDRGTFHVGDFTHRRLDLGESFDIVLCIGLLHHLEDQRAIELAQLARDYLSPGGRLITIDPVFADGQSIFARQLARADSGQCVRTEQGYRALLEMAFEDCVTHVRHDLLRVPYSHCITVATRNVSGAPLAP